MKLFLHPLSATWLACLNPNQIIALDTHQSDLSALIAINTGRAIWVQSHPHGRHALVSQLINHLSQRDEHNAVTFLEALTDDEISWLDYDSLFTAVQMGARRWLHERPSTLSFTYRAKVSRMMARIDDFPPCYREMCLDDNAAEYLSLVDESTIDRAPPTLNGLLVEIARGRKSWFVRHNKSDPRTCKINDRALGEDAFYLRVLSERVLDGIQCRDKKGPSRYPLATAVAQARSIISARPERAPVLLNMCHNLPLEMRLDDKADLSLVHESTIDRAQRTLNGLLVEIARAPSILTSKPWSKKLFIGVSLVCATVTVCASAWFKIEPLCCPLCKQAHPVCSYEIFI